MGLMKELGYRAQNGNHEAITALKHNQRMLDERASEKSGDLHRDFPWAVPSPAELAESGLNADQIRKEMEEAWGHMDEPDAEFEVWLEHEYGQSQPINENEVPF